MVDISFVSTTMSTSRLSEYDVNVPKDTFLQMIERAAMHQGYSARPVDVHELHVRNFSLSYENNNKLRVLRHGLIDATILPGTPLLVRRYNRAALQLPAFPHQDPIQWRIRRLQLRVHNRARLLFETKRQADDESARDQLRVRLEIDLGMLKDTEKADLQRTVENTIQVVLLGQRPRVCNRN